MAHYGSRHLVMPAWPKDEEMVARLTRDPGTARITLVNGVPTFDGGKPTGARPGEMVGPAPAGSA